MFIKSSNYIDLYSSSDWLLIDSLILQALYGNFRSNKRVIPLYFEHLDSENTSRIEMYWLLLDDLPQKDAIVLYLELLKHLVRDLVLLHQESLILFANSLELYYKVPNEIDMYKFFQIVREYIENSGIIELNSQVDLEVNIQDFIIANLSKIKNTRNEYQPNELKLLDDKSKIANVKIERENEIQAYLRRINHDKFKHKKKEVGKNLVMNLMNHSNVNNPLTNLAQAQAQENKRRVSNAILSKKLEVDENDPGSSKNFELNFIKDSIRVFDEQLKINTSDTAKVFNDLIAHSQWSDFRTITKNKIDLMRTYLNKYIDIIESKNILKSKYLRTIDDFYMKILLFFTTFISNLMEKNKLFQVEIEELNDIIEKYYKALVSLKELKLGKNNVINELADCKQSYVNNLNDCKIFLMQSNYRLSDKLLAFIDIMDLNLTAHKFEVEALNKTNINLRQEISVHAKNLEELKVKSYGGYLDLCNMIQLLKLENSLNQDNYFEVLSLLKNEILEFKREAEINSHVQEDRDKPDTFEKKGINDFFDDKVRYMQKNVHLVNKAIQVWVKNEGEEKVIIKSELDKTLTKHSFRTSSSNFMYDKILHEVTGNIEKYAWKSYEWTNHVSNTILGHYVQEFSGKTNLGVQKFKYVAVNWFYTRFGLLELSMAYLGIYVKSLVTWADYSTRCCMLSNLMGVVKKPYKLIYDNKFTEIRLFNYIFESCTMFDLYVSLIGIVRKEMVPLLPSEFNSYISIDYCKKVYQQLSKLFPMNLDFQGNFINNLVMKHKYRKKTVKERIHNFQKKVQSAAEEANYIFGVDKKIREIVEEKYRDGFKVDDTFDKLQSDDMFEFDIFIDTFLEEYAFSIIKYLNVFSKYYDSIFVIDSETTKLSFEKIKKVQKYLNFKNFKENKLLFNELLLASAECKKIDLESFLICIFEVKIECMQAENPIFENIYAYLTQDKDTEYVPMFDWVSHIWINNDCLWAAYYYFTFNEEYEDDLKLKSLFGEYLNLVEDNNSIKHDLNLAGVLIYNNGQNFKFKNIDDNKKFKITNLLSKILSNLNEMLTIDPQSINMFYSRDLELKRDDFI